LGREKSAGCSSVFVFSYLIFCRKTDKEDKMKRWLKSGSLKQSKDNVNPPIDLNQDDAAMEETEPLLQQSASTSSSSKKTQEKDFHVKQLTKNTATSDIVKYGIVFSLKEDTFW
jgi:hypothetical protein